LISDAKPALKKYQISKLLINSELKKQNIRNCPIVRQEMYGYDTVGRVN